MPDLGERGNVMGPQPIAPVVQPPAEMLAAAEHLLDALIRGDLASVEAMTAAQELENMRRIANEVPPGRYDKFELIGRGRISRHYFLKARLTGNDAEPFKIQFRLGETDGKWTVREALNLTGRRSGWTR
ncbi:MAG: hypothetical protein WBQ86_13855 [Candidatus Binatus sp.]